MQLHIQKFIQFICFQDYKKIKFFELCMITDILIQSLILLT